MFVIVQKAPFDEAALSIKMIQTSERNAASSTGSKISEYEAKIQELQDENFNLKQEMAVLKKMVKYLNAMYVLSALHELTSTTASGEIVTLSVRSNHVRMK